MKVELVEWDGAQWLADHPNIKDGYVEHVRQHAEDPDIEIPLAEDMVAEADAIIARRNEQKI
ncbi:hypothetical protein [Gluconacetobacter diazotrophicus]|uniref:hypothetical protein n=1 Tax=Gluconacetobacter diazotrophicus TaxID=33996 RepID=UPI00119ADC94|nr:hypothetical protein [Gluconacetobacter diazotrophicus]TWA98116.1 hypothetical protein FBZ86_1585 [Gluconacetobacter diazotrophicus]